MKQTIQQGRRRLISAVHVGKTQLGLDDDTYRALLNTVTGKTSAAKLSYQELNQVLDAMKERGFSYRKPAKRRQSPKSKGTDLDKIRAIWITMSQHSIVKDGSEAALDSYVKRMTGIDATAWLKPGQAIKVLESLKNWHRREMAKVLVKKGLTELTGHRQSWPTAKAPYDYVAAAYEEQCQ